MNFHTTRRSSRSPRQGRGSGLAHRYETTHKGDIVPRRLSKLNNDYSKGYFDPRGELIDSDLESHVLKEELMYDAFRGYQS